MEKKKLILLILGLLLIIIPFFINIYSYLKLVILLLGIILIDLSFLQVKKKKTKHYKINLFLLIYIPIILLIFTYALDYIKTYTFNLSPIYIKENKINAQVSLYDSLFYRIYKCDNNYIFDNNYERNFACKTDLIANIDINKILTEPLESYKEYKHDFIKVTGKISRIIGNSKIEMQGYTLTDNNLNGYVKFNETSKLTINLKNEDLTKYKIYDYLTVVGYVDSIDKKTNEINLTKVVIEDNNLYANYTFEVIAKKECDNTLNAYSDNYYTKCLENIYIDYGIDKYELSYALKDGKITLEDIIKKASIEEKEEIKVYNLDKFKILSCSKDKNILLDKNEKLDYSLCAE